MTTTPTRRRQRLGATERREQIMAATVVVLAAHGYQGASADAIAQQAGVSKGLLWHYFASRDDVMEQTAKRTLIALRGAVGELIDLTAPVPDLIRAAIHAAASLRQTHSAERRAMQEIIVNLRSADGSTRLTLRDYEDTYAAQEEIFRRGQTEGDIDASLDPRILAVTYQGAVDAMLGYLDTHGDADADRFADSVADVLLAGARSRPARARRLPVRPKLNPT